MCDHLLILLLLLLLLARMIEDRLPQKFSFRRDEGAGPGGRPMDALNSRACSDLRGTTPSLIEPPGHIRLRL